MHSALLCTVRTDIMRDNVESVLPRGLFLGGMGHCVEKWGGPSFHLLYIYKENICRENRFTLRFVLQIFLHSPTAFSKFILARRYCSVWRSESPRFTIHEMLGLTLPQQQNIVLFYPAGSQGSNKSELHDNLRKYQSTWVGLSNPEMREVWVLCQLCFLPGGRERVI